MDLENFFHPGAIISNFHDLPDEKRPKFVPMTLFIDEAGTSAIASTRQTRKHSDKLEEMADKTLDTVATGGEGGGAGEVLEILHAVVI